jgi:hypothetical protein
MSRTTAPTLTSWIGLAALLLGCPGDDEAEVDERGGSAMPLQVCEAHLSWDRACAELEPEPRQDPFWGESECQAGPWHLLQAAYIEAAADCFSSLPCERSDDACTSAGFAALGIESEEDLERDAELQRCVDLAHACDEVSEDFCFFFAVFTGPGRRQAAACLELDCAAASACFEQL